MVKNCKKLKYNKVNLLYSNSNNIINNIIR